MFSDPNDKSRSGLCSLTLFHESLFRDSYTVAVVGPLAEATSVYVIAIVRTLDSEFIEIESGWGTVQVPDLCQDVNGKSSLFQLQTLWSRQVGKIPPPLLNLKKK